MKYEYLCAKKIRIDKWLWAARFFRTRSLAANAVNGGKVHVNGQRVKSSRAIQIGDKLEITRGQFLVAIEIRELSETRGPTTVAQKLYQETQESIEAREIKTQQRKLLNASVPYTKGKPDKHQRREIRKVSGKS